MYDAYLNGRADKDPSLGWYDGELWFFDNYVIPLARKLEECGVFGASSDEYLNYALQNRREWAAKGRDKVEDFKRRVGARVEVDPKVPVQVESGDSGEGETKASEKAETADSVEAERMELSVSNSDTEISEKLCVTPGIEIGLEGSPQSNEMDETLTSQGKMLAMESGQREVVAPPGKLDILIEPGDGAPIVSRVLPGSPLRGMLQQGDRILAVNDVAISGMSMEAITALIQVNGDQDRRLTVES